MTKRELIIEEVANIPEPLFDEILDFIHFVKSKMSSRAKIKSETALASQSLLGKDWLSPEEESAWSDL